MFFSNILVEKNRKCGSGGRKSTYCDATDNQPTTHQVKLRLYPLPLLLIYHKYMNEVGKLSRRFIAAAFWAKKNPKYESVGRKSIYRDATDIEPTAQQDKSGLNLLSMLLIYHKYIDQVGKQPRRCFSSIFWAKKI